MGRETGRQRSRVKQTRQCSRPNLYRQLQSASMIAIDSDSHSHSDSTPAKQTASCATAQCTLKIYSRFAFPCSVSLQEGGRLMLAKIIKKYDKTPLCVSQCAPISVVLLLCNPFTFLLCNYFGERWRPANLNNVHIHRSVAMALGEELIVLWF